MKIRTLTQFGSALVLSLSSVVIIAAPKALAASTDTWTGTDCSGSTPNCNWSDTSNWSANAAPVSGDSLVFPNASIDGFAKAPNDDITGLSVSSITFTGDATNNGDGYLTLAKDLTVTSAITQDSTVTTTTDGIQSLTSGRTITLGGDVTVTPNGTGNLILGTSGTNDTLALNGHALSFVETSTVPKIVSIAAAITGSGTVNYNAPYTEFQLSNTASNTYSGTTNITASNLPVENQEDNVDPFGSSTINIGLAGAVGFEYNTSGTISNPIVIAGTVNNSQVTSLSFNCGTGCNGPVTVTVPNITLNGNTRFASDDQQTINIAGITSNGHCLEYLDATSNQADQGLAGFPGGPAACVVEASVGSSASSASAPKTPDTGLAAVTAHPIVTLAATAMAAGTILVVARRIKPATKR